VFVERWTVSVEVLEVENPGVVFDGRIRQGGA
jgi:hypothetical protein